MLAVGTAEAIADEPSKVALTKAAFVLNFGKYTEWPAHRFAAPDSPVQLCLLRVDSDIGRAMQRIDGKNVRGREIRVHTIRPGKAVDDCHILFVEQEAVLKHEDWMSSLAEVPVLTISDAPGFAARGGVIELVPSDMRLGFEVNLAAAKRAELRLGSQLLALARIVKGK
ncbi:MAG TPA: YfiR family protein [Arenimonas sp.]|nr:YfiR family protein [Arenimonas sp.]